MELVDGVFIASFSLMLFGNIACIARQKNESADHFLSGHDAPHPATGFSISISSIGSKLRNRNSRTESSCMCQPEYMGCKFRPLYPWHHSCILHLLLVNLKKQNDHLL